MQDPLHVLVIRDPGFEALDLREALQTTGRQIEPQIVRTPGALRAALDDRLPDLVVGDCDMQRFRCEDALTIVRSKAPRLPMILLARSFAHELAGDLLRAGASALVEKDQLYRLADAVERALAQSIKGTPRAPPPAPEQAHERQTLLGGVFASAADAIVSADHNQRILLFNPAAEELFGYQAHEVQGESLGVLLPDRFRAAHAERITEFGLSGTSRRRVGSFGTIMGRKKSGEEFPIDATISQWKGARGKVYTAVLRPIRAHPQIEDSRAVLAAIVESAEDAIVGKTLDGIIRTWSPGAERLFGYESSEIIGRPMTALLPADRLNEEQLIIERIRRGERVESYESKRLCKDGTLVDVSLTISPIRSEDGTIIGASKIARNITARIASERRERRLAAFYAALSQTNEALCTCASQPRSMRKSAVFASSMARSPWPSSPWSKAKSSNRSPRRAAPRNICKGSACPFRRTGRKAAARWRSPSAADGATLPTTCIPTRSLNRGASGPCALERRRRRSCRSGAPAPSRE
jgi:PAS domain S-box-containing protein